MGRETGGKLREVVRNDIQPDKPSKIIMAFRATQSHSWFELAEREGERSRALFADT